MKSKKPLILIPVFVSAIALGVVFYPQEAEAHGSPAATISTLSVYQDGTTTLGAGTAICTGLDISGGTATCGTELLTGTQYRFEVVIAEINNVDYTPTSFDAQSVVANLDVFGTTPTYGSAGCTQTPSQNNDWSLATNGGNTEGSGGTSCTWKNGSETFFMIVTLDTDADDDTMTFWISDGTNEDTSATITFTGNAPPAGPTYSVDTLAVYQSESTTLGSGTAICTALDISTGTPDCSGVLNYGFPYRFEVTVSNSGSAASPTSLEIDSSVGSGDVFGTIVAGEVLDSGCSTNTDWTESIAGGTDVRAASGTTCSIAGGGGTAVFWIVVKVQAGTGGLGTSPASTFTIDGGGDTNTSVSTTFNSDNLFVNGGGVY